MQDGNCSNEKKKKKHIALSKATPGTGFCTVPLIRNNYLCEYIVPPNFATFDTPKSNVCCINIKWLSNNTSRHIRHGVKARLPLFTLLTAKTWPLLQKNILAKVSQLIFGLWASADTLVVGVREIMSQYSAADIWVKEGLLATAAECRALTNSTFDTVYWQNAIKNSLFFIFSLISNGWRPNVLL